MAERTVIGFLLEKLRSRDILKSGEPPRLADGLRKRFDDFIADGRRERIPAREVVERFTRSVISENCADFDDHSKYYCVWIIRDALFRDVDLPQLRVLYSYDSVYVREEVERKYNAVEAAIKALAALVLEIRRWESKEAEVKEATSKHGGFTLGSLKNPDTLATAFAAATPKPQGQQLIADDVNIKGTLKILIDGLERDLKGHNRLGFLPQGYTTDYFDLRGLQVLFNEYGEIVQDLVKVGIQTFGTMLNDLILLRNRLKHGAPLSLSNLKVLNERLDWLRVRMPYGHPKFDEVRSKSAGYNLAIQLGESMIGDLKPDEIKMLWNDLPDLSGFIGMETWSPLESTPESIEDGSTCGGRSFGDVTDERLYYRLWPADVYCRDFEQPLDVWHRGIERFKERAKIRGTLEWAVDECMKHCEFYEPCLLENHVVDREPEPALSEWAEHDSGTLSIRWTSVI